LSGQSRSLQPLLQRYRRYCRPPSHVLSSAVAQSAGLAEHRRWWTSTNAAKALINTFVQSTRRTLSGVISALGDRAVVAPLSRRRPIVFFTQWRNAHG
jgi:hypothetical protein